VTAPPLNQIVGMLEKQRRDLLAQLAAVDKAIAALQSAPASVAETPSPEPQPAADQAAGEVLPRRVTPKRVLSDEHKQALVVAKRRSRNAQEAAKGLAREMPVDSFVPAIGKRGERQAPRLIKRPTNK
jgi:hypothetical protein